MSTLSRASDNYSLLCKKTLESNLHSKNKWLVRNGFFVQDGAAILSFSLQGNVGDEKQETMDVDGVRLFINSRDIQN